MPRVSIAALREKIARIEAAGVSFEEKKKKVPLGHADADAALLGGIAPGALHEIYVDERDCVSGSAFAAMLALRVARSGSVILWVRQEFTAHQCGQLSAQGLFDLGINPDRLLLVKTRSGAEALPAASESLSCKALGAVILEVWRQPKSLDLVASRKLTLRAGRSNVTIFLIRVAAAEEMPSTAETRWFVRAKRTPDFIEEWGNPLFEATLARNRHGHTGAWAMEWSCDARVFREVPQNSSALLPDVAGGPRPPEPETQRRNVSG